MRSKYAIGTAIAILLSTLLIYVPTGAFAQNRIYSAAMRLEDRGKFAEAAALLKKALEGSAARLSPRQKEQFLFQIERMRRIRIDYSLTSDELFSQLQKGIRDVTLKEFHRWMREGKFDSRVIDDTLRFVSASRSNLFFRYPEIAVRRIPPVDQRAHNLYTLNNCISIERASDSLHTPYVLPKRFEMKMAINVDSGTVRPGNTVRAWLPIPRRFPYQLGFNLVRSSSKPVAIAPENSPIRSVYMEQPADSDGGASFFVDYTYQTYGVHFTLDPRRVAPYDRSDSIYVKFTKQNPNMVFTGKIRKLSQEIVGKATNPLTKAKRIYDWIAHNIQYSFAREYSTINNISGYCLDKRYGDCGQEAMLFITLCRYNGIPARWQSGWYFMPGGKDIHDWTEIYILPYGWVPVDPYMGILSTQYMTTLTSSERKEVRDFYFGGLDQYRMSANSDNNQQLVPPKKYFRSDNVDFQRGELETATHNIYFNRFDYSLTVDELTGNGGR